MDAEKAKSYYHGVEKYNCAQAVLKAFQEKYDVSEEMIEEYKQFGGGRAEDNMCGALYAALTIAGDEHKDLLTESFVDAAKYTACRPIKSEKTLSCPNCVGVVAETLASL